MMKPEPLPLVSEVWISTVTTLGSTALTTPATEVGARFADFGVSVYDGPIQLRPILVRAVAASPMAPPRVPTISATSTVMASVVPRPRRGGWPPSGIIGGSGSHGGPPRRPARGSRG